jgi:hypothetical protein
MRNRFEMDLNELKSSHACELELKLIMDGSGFIH